MKRLVKWIGFTLMGFLLLILTIIGISYYYKSDILAAVNKELKKNIQGSIHIGDIDFSFLEDFPSFSITLKDFYLRSKNYNVYKRDFLSAQKISLDVQIVSFLQKKIVIRSVRIIRGDVFIFRARNGNTNLDIFEKSASADTAALQNGVSITLKKIFLENVKISYQDSMKQKSFGADLYAIKTNIAKTDSSYRLSLVGSLKFDALTLNKQRGGFLKQKQASVRLDLEFASKTRNLIVHPSSLKFDRSDLTLSGGFHFANPGVFTLAIKSEDLDYKEGTSLVTETIQSKLKKFNIEKPFSILTTIHGPLEGGAQPSIDIQFHFSKSKVSIPKITIERATVAGSFMNHSRTGTLKNDENSILTITSFSGKIEGLPTNLTATFKNLKDPSIDLHSFISLDLYTINEKVDTTRMKFLSGEFKSEINYSGKLSEYLDPDKTNFAGKLRGSVSVKNGAFDYKPRQQHLKNISASIRFTSDSLLIDTLRVAVNKNAVSIKGKVLGFVPFFHQPETKGYINLFITSPSFDLSALLTKTNRKKMIGSKQSKNKKSISEMLDKLYTKIECDLTVQVNKLSYQNFQGSNVRGRLLMDNNSLKAVNMKMKLAEGDVNFTLSLNDLQKDMKRLAVAGTVEHADIRKFFYAFNNFNQATINHKNLEGNFKMNVKFNSRIRDDFTIMPRSMKGSVNLLISDGKLDHFEPLQKMNNFLFKNRDFDEVQFGEINTKLTLEGPELNIERMEVESSVLRLFLEGRYSFADSTDLSVQLPLSNLKKRDKNYQPKNIGVDAKAGPSIFLHVYKDETGKTVFAYDPFKRHVKK